jgi:hypothetical protein
MLVPDVPVLGNAVDQSVMRYYQIEIKKTARRTSDTSWEAFSPVSCSECVRTVLVAAPCCMFRYDLSFFLFWVTVIHLAPPRSSGVAGLRGERAARQKELREETPNHICP